MFNNGWSDFLKEEFAQPYFRQMSAYLHQAYDEKTIYPRKEDVFNAFGYTDYPDVKVVILGQDPYHEPNQAHGLSFSVKPSVPAPPSLQNIFRELYDDLGIQASSPCLIPWARQGVFLLNTVLTVEAHKAGSHQNLGWRTFTDKVIQKLNEHPKPLVFILWGKYAQSKKVLIDTSRHCVIESVHPSPLSAYRGFFGSKPFSRANAFLKAHGNREVDWRV